MKPCAHIQATIELCQLIFDQIATPADKIMNHYFRARRYIGSKDKRAIADRVYGVLRVMPRYDKHTHRQARLTILYYLRDVEACTVEAISAVCSGETYAPSPLTASERLAIHTLPSWDDYERLAIPQSLLPYFMETYTPETCDALAQSYLTEAAFDIRVNTLKASRDVVLQQLMRDHMPAIPTPLSETGIRFTRRHSLEGYPLLKEGVIEVQDEGSQLIAAACDARPGMNVLDYCAGAGGKTLALAAHMNNKGQLFACDIHSWRLDRARERMRRAGVHNVRFYPSDDAKFLKRHAQFFDRVLVDAPCSGTGTWRRNPDMKFKTTATDIDELCRLQRDILAKSAPMVKVGGYLIYATCSVLHAENAAQSAWFLNQYPDFKRLSVDAAQSSELMPCFQRLQHCAGRADARTLLDSITHSSEINGEIHASEGIQLLPHTHQTDGFFIDIFKRHS